MRFAEASPVPPDDYAPLDAAIARLPAYSWLIVTSVNGVHALLGRMEALGVKPAALTHLHIGAIGPATARALEDYGLHAEFMPGEYVAEAILAEIGAVAGQHILLPRADIARAALAIGLRERGAEVDEIAVYHTVPGDGVAALAEHLLHSDREKPYLDAEQLNEAKAFAPGYDVYALYEEWASWWRDMEKPSLRNPALAFFGFCRKKSESRPLR